jgi:hypothetical protein
MWVRACPLTAAFRGGPARPCGCPAACASDRDSAQRVCACLVHPSTRKVAADRLSSRLVRRSRRPHPFVNGQAGCVISANEGRTATFGAFHGPCGSGSHCPLFDYPRISRGRSHATLREPGVPRWCRAPPRAVSPLMTLCPVPPHSPAPGRHHPFDDGHWRCAMSVNGAPWRTIGDLDGPCGSGPPCLSLSSSQNPPRADRFRFARDQTGYGPSRLAASLPAPLSQAPGSRRETVSAIFQIRADCYAAAWRWRSTWRFCLACAWLGWSVRIS